MKQDVQGCGSPEAVSWAGGTSLRGALRMRAVYSHGLFEAKALLREID